MAALAPTSNRSIAAMGSASRDLVVLADRGVRLVCALWLGVMAGFFYAFSALVMPGLAETDPAAAIPAMRGINDAVGNPLFGLGFFGVLPICLLVIVRSFARHDLGGWLAALGATVYLLGVFVVTVAFNIPLNDELDGREPGRAADLARMPGWIDEWSTWNDLRTASAVLAFALVAASLLPTVSRGRDSAAAGNAAAERRGSAGSDGRRLERGDGATP